MMIIVMMMMMMAEGSKYYFGFTIGARTQSQFTSAALGRVRLRESVRGARVFPATETGEGRINGEYLPSPFSSTPEYVGLPFNTSFC